MIIDYLLIIAIDIVAKNSLTVSFKIQLDL